jgi:hypothetical protein
MFLIDAKQRTVPTGQMRKLPPPFFDRNPMARLTSDNVAPKGPPSGSHNNSQKSFESERITSQIEAFEKSGGHVEKLGVTPYIHRPAPSKPTKSAPTPPDGRPRVR